MLLNQERIMVISLQDFFHFLFLSSFNNTNIGKSHSRLQWMLFSNQTKLFMLFGQAQSNDYPNTPKSGLLHALLWQVRFLTL